MIQKTRLFTPGPTPLLPAAQFAMAAADMHHRTPEFRTLFQKVIGQLKVFIGTQNDVLLLSSSGTGAMEASVSNLTSPGDRVLVLTAGKFGERWVDLTKTFGCQVDVVEKPYGQTFDLAEVKAALKPEHKAIFMQASETSTGVSHDVEGVADLVKGTETLLVVDGITGLGTTTFDVDGWGIDILIGGSQKAVMMSPGLAYLSVSEKAWKAMDTSKNPRYYFDLRKERKNQGKGETAYTPAVSLVAGPGRGAGLHCRAGWRRSGKGPHRADQQRADERQGDARRTGGAGLHALCAHLAFSGGNRCVGAGRAGFERRGQGAEDALQPDGCQRAGHDEGQDLPRGASGLLRLPGHGGLPGRYGAHCQGDAGSAGGLRAGGGGGAAGVRGCG
jgi:hypothetical protein